MFELFAVFGTIFAGMALLHVQTAILARNQRANDSERNT